MVTHSQEDPTGAGSEGQGLRLPSSDPKSEQCWGQSSLECALQRRLTAAGLLTQDTQHHHSMKNMLDPLYKSDRQPPKR